MEYVYPTTLFSMCRIDQLIDLDGLQLPVEMSEAKASNNLEKAAISPTQTTDVSAKKRCSPPTQPEKEEMSKAVKDSLLGTFNIAVRPKILQTVVPTEGQAKSEAVVQAADQQKSIDAKQKSLFAEHPGASSLFILKHVQNGITVINSYRI